MSKKRRMFDIDLPEDDSPLPDQDLALRRGPMATAITETASASRARAVVEDAIRAENDALAHEFVRLKKLGLIADRLPLDSIRIGKLVRDRANFGPHDLDDLVASIRAVGLSNPIRVEPDGQGGYELIEGFRRLSAFRRLAESGDENFAKIPASFVPPGESVEGLYRRMVDENLVRKDISWAEMARLARAYADEGVGGCSSLDQAVNILYASANAQKRSYIRRFASLLARLGDALLFAEYIPRALGLTLSHRLDLNPDLADAITAALSQHPDRDGDQEVRILAGFESLPDPISPRGNASRGRPAKRDKTVLRLPLSFGEVKCTALPGKIELQLDRDFSVMDRARIQRAIEAFLRSLDQP